MPADAVVALIANMHQAQLNYNNMLSVGAKPEDARAVLPNACHTEFVVTANFRAWNEFLQKRTDRAAQGEIRELASTIQKVLQTDYSAVFGELDE